LFRSRPLLTRFVAFVVVPCLCLAFYVPRHLRASLPEAAGNLAVEGLSAPVEIVRDVHGVPTITAKTDRDAFFAAGYVHAQDRLWQLELQRRIVDGRLAEVFGKGSISDDVWLRTLGLRRAAEASWQTLTPEAQESLLAYTAGINAWLAHHDSLPPEFGLLGITPRPWSVYDSLGWNNMFALTMGGNFREEIARYVASQSLAPQMLQAMFEGYPADAPVTVAAGEQVRTRKLAALGDYQKHLESRLKLGGKYVGSNAWAVSGRWTGDGQSILANDPHLPLQLPSLWYAMRLNGDRLHATGMSLVGLPVVIFGHNAHVAWGGTNMMADQQDLYFERVNPVDPGQYEVNGHWEKFATRTETIAVKNDFPAFLRSPLRPITVEVRATRHGPVISDQFDLFEQPVALRWSLLENKGSSYESLYRVNFSHDWERFNDSFRGYVAPALNLLYSDDRGNIGYVGVGKIPLRNRGEGTLPVPGWNDDYDWHGSIPYEAMPRSFNPAKGYIVNANNRITADDYPYFISHDWAPRARASRIEQLLQAKLAAKKQLSVADMRDIQADVANKPSATLLKTLAGFRGRSDAQREAVALLAKWDGNMDRDSVGATLFYAWTDHLRSYIFLDEIEGPWNRRGRTPQLEGLIDRVSDDELAAILANDPSHWCDHHLTPAVESCQEAMALSLQRTLKTLRKVGGSDLDDWKWGTIHETLYEHTPFSSTTLLRRFFERHVGNGGAPNSVNVASADLQPAKGYVQTFGAGFRQIMSLGAHGDQHLYMNSTGQSGNVLSDHYDDMIVPFRDVAYYPFAPAAPPASTITLRPLARQRP
jgi:penicillin amidase